MSERKTPRQVSERQIAISLLLAMADCDMEWFSLLEAYDDDVELVAATAERANVLNNVAFTRKLRTVVRNCVRYGVFAAQMRGTHKEYLGEPAKQMDYMLKPGKLKLLQRGETAHTMGPEGEAAFLLRHVYPDPAL